MAYSTKVVSIFVIIALGAGLLGGALIGREFLALQPSGGSSVLSGEITIGIMFANEKGANDLTVAVNLAFEDINKFLEDAGRDLSFKGYLVNNDGSGARTTENLATLLGAGIKVIVGPSWSSQIRAMLSTLDDREVVLISDGASSVDLSIPNDYVFRTTSDNTLQGVPLMTYCRDQGIKVVLCAHTNDASGLDYTKYFKVSAEELGMEFVDVIGVDPEKMDYTAEFSEVAAKFNQYLNTYSAEEIAIDYIGHSSIASQMINALVQYPELLTAGVIVDSDNGEQQIILENAGQTAATAGVICQTVGWAETPDFEEFQQRFKARAGYDPSTYSAVSYDAVWLACISIVTANEYDGPAVKAVVPLVANQMNGLTGWMQLNENGDRKYYQALIDTVVKEGGTFQWKKIGFFNGNSIVYD